ncbi:MAG: MFS transporter [Candidatus Bathyarchaeia archaeon]|jgi:predicted MFS family arabinose efflux permease
MNEKSAVNKGFKRVLLLPAVLLGTFLAYSISVFTSTLLVDIASSFKVSIGTASQLGLISSLIGLIMGLAMGAISLKFKHKSLFLLGIASFAVGTLGFFVAQNFATVLLFQFFIGVGAAIISIMSYALIGDLFPLERRGWVVGLTVSAVMASFVIVAPLSGFIAGIAGWRMVLLSFIFPLSIACLAIGFFGIPSKQSLPQSSKSLYSEAFKQILLNKSAMACVIGTTLFTCIGVIPVYAVSFYRIAFSVSPAIGGVFSSVAAFGGILGGVTSGKLINRCGRKPLTVAASVASGISSILFTYIPNMLISVAFWAIAATFASITVAALYSLVLEQVPSFKASMMSINLTFQNAGLILGLIIGGLVLNLDHNNFQLLMTIFGALGATAGAIVLLLAKDTCKTAQFESLSQK